MTPGTSVMRVLVIGAGTWVALSCATTPNAPTVGSVALQSTADTVAIGDSIALTAAVRSDGGTLIDIPVSWSSSEPSVASVTGGGWVHGLAAGDVTVSAEAGGRSASTAIAVLGPAAGVSFRQTSSSPSAFLPEGSEELTLDVWDAAGHALRSAPVTLASSDASVMSVDGDVVTAIKPGDAIITASTGTMTDSLPVRVRGVQATIPLGLRPYGIAVADNGRYFVTRLDAASVSGGTLPDPTLTDSVPTGTIPTSVAFSPDGKLAYTADQGGTVTIIDAASAQRIDSVQVPGSPFVVGVVPTTGEAWVVGNQGKAYVLDMNAREIVDSVEIGNAPNGIAFTADGAHAFVTDFVGSRIVDIDVTARQVVHSIDIPGFPQGATVSPDGNEVWVAREHGCVLVLSSETGTVIDSAAAATGGFGITFARDGDVVLVTRVFEGELIAIRRETRNVIGRIAVGGDPRRITTHVGGTVLVADQDGNVIVIR